MKNAECRIAPRHLRPGGFSFCSLYSSFCILHLDASVAGLAPAKFCLKGRALELLCIHGLTKGGMKSAWCRVNGNGAIFHSAVCIPHSSFNWSPRLVSRQRLLVFSEALICLSYSGRRKWMMDGGWWLIG